MNALRRTFIAFVLILGAATSTAFAQTSSPVQTLIVNVASANLRDKPSTTGSTVVVVLSQGDELDVLEPLNAGWYRVRVKSSGRTGYVSNTVVRVAPAAPAAPPAPPPAAADPVPATQASPASRPGFFSRRVIRIAGGVLYQVSTSDVSDSASFSESLETTTFGARQTIPAGMGIDVSGGVTFARNFGFGVGLTSFSKTTDATITGQIPHPFFFNKPRSLEGTVALERQETAIHIDALYVVPINSRLELMVFGGPTFFSVKQAFVEDLDYSDDYPYDSVTFNSATAESISKSKMGFNAGADVTYKLNTTVGVGGLVRFSTASIDFERDSGAPVNVSVGGLQVGGGIRLRF